MQVICEEIAVKYLPIQLFRQMQIFPFIFMDLLDQLLSYFADDAGGNAQHHVTIGDDHVFLDYSPCTDDTVAADLSPRQDDGSHADHAVIADGAPVNDGTVADGAASANGGGVVEDAVVLNVGVLSHMDGANVSADHRTVPDADVVVQCDVSDHGGVGSDMDGAVFNDVAHVLFPFVVLFSVLYPKQWEITSVNGERKCLGVRDFEALIRMLSYSADDAAADLAACIARGLGMEIIGVTVDDHRAADHIRYTEAVRAYTEIGTAAAEQQWGKVSCMAGMRFPMGIIMSAAVFKISAAAAFTLVDVQGKKACVAVRQAFDICCYQNAATLLIESNIPG